MQHLAGELVTEAHGMGERARLMAERNAESTDKGREKLGLTGVGAGGGEGFTVMDTDRGVTETYSERLRQDARYEGMVDRFRQILGESTVYMHDISGAPDIHQLQREMAKGLPSPDIFLDPQTERKKGAIVFLIDHSGSMETGGRKTTADRACMAMAQAARRAGFDVAVYAYGSSLVRGQPKERAQSDRISVPSDELGTTNTADALAGVFQDQERGLLSARRYPRRIVVHLTDGAPDSPSEVKHAVGSLIKRGIHVATLGIDLDSGAISHLENTYPIWANVQEVGHVGDALMAIGRTIMHQRRPVELKKHSTPVFTPSRLKQKDLDRAGAGAPRRRATRRRTPV